MNIKNDCRDTYWEKDTRAYDENMRAPFLWLRNENIWNVNIHRNSNRICDIIGKMWWIERKRVGSGEKRMWTNKHQWIKWYSRKMYRYRKIEWSGYIIEIKYSDGRMKMRRFRRTNAIDTESILSIQTSKPYLWAVKEQYH